MISSPDYKSGKKYTYLFILLSLTLLSFLKQLLERGLGVGNPQEKMQVKIKNKKKREAFARNFSYIGKSGKIGIVM